MNFSFKISKENMFGLASNDSIVDYLSLIGIKSDNIDGIKGIGPVRARKLLNFGNVSYLLNNDEWKDKYRSPAIVKLVEDNAGILEFYCNELIPFQDGITIDESLKVVKNVPSDYYRYTDSMPLLESIRPIAEKYNLPSIKWRLRQRVQYT